MTMRHLLLHSDWRCVESLHEGATFSARWLYSSAVPYWAGAPPQKTLLQRTHLRRCGGVRIGGRGGIWRDARGGAHGAAAKSACAHTCGAAARAGATPVGAGASACPPRIAIRARRLRRAAERIGGRGDARSAVGRAELRSGNRRAGGRRIQSKGARTLAGYALTHALFQRR